MTTQLQLAIHPVEDSDDVIIYLINSSHLDFEYEVFTGAFTSVDDDLLETSKVVREKKFIKAYSTEVFEKTDYGEFDFVIWYQVDFFAKESAIKLLLEASLPKYDAFNEEKYDSIQYTNLKGLLVPLTSRNDNIPIQQEIIGMDMNSKYWENTKNGLIEKSQEPKQKILFDVNKLSTEEIYSDAVKFLDLEQKKETGSELVEKAMQFAYKIHQVDQWQTRKGTLIPYIVHPLSVGKIIERAGGNEDTISAGILHDTIEDCKPYGSVTKEQLEKEFGPDVARMVNDVSEQDRSLPWEPRKQQALEHIYQMQKDSQMVKAADVLNNLSDQIDDYRIRGESIFARFDATKVLQLERYQKLVLALEQVWSDNPILPSLKEAVEEARKLWS